MCYCLFVEIRNMFIEKKKTKEKRNNRCVSCIMVVLFALLCVVAKHLFILCVYVYLIICLLFRLLFVLNYCL